MVVGQPPFSSENDAVLLSSIVMSDFDFPVGQNLTLECQDLIARLLTKNPLKRFGIENGALDIINHPWFGGFDFKS
jgi:serine/threonine protein kinase